MRSSNCTWLFIEPLCLSLSRRRLALGNTLQIDGAAMLREKELHLSSQILHTGKIVRDIFD